jgi:Kdo2-lipid IVA lauroyltransferase/acyltransferase
MKILIRVILWLFSLPSWESSDRWGARIGRILHLFGVRKKVVMENLNRVFGATDAPPERKKTKEEIARISQACYENFGRVIVLYLRGGLMDEKFFAERWEVEGEEHFLRAMAKGRGVIAVGGHIGVWEFAIMKVGRMGYPAALIAKNVKNELMNRWVVDMRAHNKLATIQPKNSREEIIEVLKKGGFVVSVMDQNMRSRQGIFIDVLGRLASTVKSTPGIARESGAPVISGWARRIGPARYRLTFGPEIPWIADEDHDRERQLNTQNYSRALEKVILEKPEDWFWLHRRWKRRPEGEAEPVKS